MVNRMEAPFSTQYLQLFNSLWNDNSKLQDVTDVIINNISTAYNENSPEFIYFMLLYNVFNEFLDDLSEDVLPNEATGFKQSKIWSMLYDFQKDAVLISLKDTTAVFWLIALALAKHSPHWLL